MISNRVKFSTLIAACLLQFCAIGPAFGQEQEAGDAPTIFYPSPPSPPRLQFLKVYSSSLDLATKNKGFRDFVFGGQENEKQLLIKPYGLAVHDNAIYVVDTRGNGYGVFDLHAGRTRMVQPSGAGALNKPLNITIDEDGTRYVTDAQRGQVVVFNANDRFLKAIGAPGQFKPIDVAIAGNRLYVTDMDNHQVAVLDKATGEELFRFGGPGVEPGKLAHPSSLALGTENTILVVDTSNFRVQEFDLEGEFIRAMGSVGNNPGQFSRPKGIDVDNDGNIYVLDAAFSNVQVLDPADGGAKMAFGRVGGPDSIELPSVVKIDYDVVPYFRQFAAPNFDLKYIVLVTSQFGPNKVVVYGFGELVE